MPASEPKQVDDSPPPEKGMMGKIGFLKMYKAVESDGPSTSFFNDGGQVLTSEITRFVGSL